MKLCVTSCDCICKDNLSPAVNQRLNHRLCRLTAHHNWLMQQLQDARNQHHPFWQAIDLVMAQLLGMMEGYNARVSVDGQELDIEHMELREWLALNTMGG